MKLLCTMALAVLAATALADSKPVNWEVKDTQGRAVKVPAEKPSVLVFVRPGQPQSDKAIQEVGATAASAQLVAIVSGDDAAQGAAKLAGKFSGALVADPQYAGSGKFTVRVWPTTVVVSKAGVEVAHIAGLPASFAKDLDAYVDFAQGKIDKATLEKRLAGNDLVGDSTDQKAARHLEVAQRLAAHGSKELAKVELAKAIELKATEGHLQGTVARVQLLLGETKEAQATIATPRAGMGPGELHLLQGWVAVQQQRWEEAEKLLADAVKLNPQPSEGYYLLGLVQTQKKDTAKAAESFRKAFEHTPVGRAMAGN